MKTLERLLDLDSIIQIKESILLYMNNQLAVTSFNINIAVLRI